MILGVAGLPGSGKEEFNKIVKEQGYTVLRIGDVVRDFVKGKSLELTDANIGKIASKERERHGYAIWAERTLSRITRENLVIDGIRNWEEVEVFKKSFPGFVVIALWSPWSTRYQRLAKRARKDRPVSVEEFKQRDERELGWGLGKVLALADAFIINHGTLKEFRRKVKELLKNYF